MSTRHSNVREVILSTAGKIRCVARGVRRKEAQVPFGCFKDIFIEEVEFKVGLEDG